MERISKQAKLMLLARPLQDGVGLTHKCLLAAKPLHNCEQESGRLICVVV